MFFLPQRIAREGALPSAPPLAVQYKHKRNNATEPATREKKRRPASEPPLGRKHCYPACRLSRGLLDAALVRRRRGSARLAPPGLPRTLRHIPHPQRRAVAHRRMLRHNLPRFLRPPLARKECVIG